MKGEAGLGAALSLNGVLKPAVIVLVVLLALNGTAAAALRTSPPVLPFNVQVPFDYYEFVQIGTISVNSTVSFAAEGDVPFSTAFMTSSQFMSFNNSESDLSNSFFIQNGTIVQQTLHPGLGTYYLVFFAYSDDVNVDYNYAADPVDPYLNTPLTAPQPTGVAAFGIYNDSGNAVPYQVLTNEVVGVANINSLQAYNATAELLNNTVSGATLQLNSVLVVNETNGLQQVYWAQNTPDFVTAASQVALADNVWNFSTSGLLSNSTVTSPDGGYVYSFDNFGTTGYYYSDETSNSTYAFPVVLALFMNETVLPGQGVLVQMGAQMLQNGTGPVTSVTWFDNITIHDPTVQTAHFLVSGDQTVTGGFYYDTELVFGGESNGAATTFTQMDASLGLFYVNASNGALQAFPSLYSFGGDTGEGAYNLQVHNSGNGFSEVTTGTPDYVYLGHVSKSLALPLTASELELNSSGTQTSSASSTSQQSSSTQGSTGQSSTGQTSTSSNSSSLAYDWSYLSALLLSVVAVFVVLGGKPRRKGRAISI